MQDNDRIRLRHMLDSACDAVAFAEGKSRADLDSDRQLVMAVVKCVEIIGEAANQVSPAARTELKEISWRDMIDMRHRLVHGYYDINLDVVWSTLQEDLPPLIEMLRAIPGVKDKA